MAHVRVSSKCGRCGRISANFLPDTLSEHLAHVAPDKRGVVPQKGTVMENKELVTPMKTLDDVRAQFNLIYGDLTAAFLLAGKRRDDLMTLLQQASDVVVDAEDEPSKTKIIDMARENLKELARILDKDETTIPEFEKSAREEYREMLKSISVVAQRLTSATLEAHHIAYDMASIIELPIESVAKHMEPILERVGELDMLVQNIESEGGK